MSQRGDEFQTEASGPTARISHHTVAGMGADGRRGWRQVAGICGQGPRVDSAQCSSISGPCWRDAPSPKSRSFHFRPRLCTQTAAGHEPRAKTKNLTDFVQRQAVCWKVAVFHPLLLSLLVTNSLTFPKLLPQAMILAMLARNEGGCSVTESQDAEPTPRTTRRLCIGRTASLGGVPRHGGRPAYLVSMARSIPLGRLEQARCA